jgi:hypothetical protein
VKGGSLNDDGSTIVGNLQADGALFFEIGGAGQIGGNVQVTGVTSYPTSGSQISPSNFLCNSVVDGNVQVLNNSADSPFVIGGPDTETGAGTPLPCTDGPLVIGGNLQVQFNKARVLMQHSGVGPTHGNTAAGNIEVNNNTGGGELQDNHAGANCRLYDNDPAFSVGGNTAAGNINSCNDSVN